MRLAIRILRAARRRGGRRAGSAAPRFLDLAELRDRDRFVAWLLGIVVNLAKSRLRLRREVPVEDFVCGP
jgi:DNA-directed RNA polymerase specialized sigma24 family protein